MIKPTHTHCTQGGRFALVGEQPGGGVLEGQTLACYLDLDKDLKSVTTIDDWKQNWKPIAADDCPVCLGAGTDQIKGNAANPCGGCFGLGKVRKDGEPPADRWELATVATAIIQRQQQELERLRQVAALPEVREVLQARKERQQKEGPPDWVQKEQEWRNGSGKGAGGRRYTGD